VRLVTAFLAVPLLAATLLACATIPAPTKLDPRTARPCEFLTEEEAGKIMDKPTIAVMSGELKTPADSDSLVCTFGYVDDTEIAGLTLHIIGLEDPARASLDYERRQTQAIQQRNHTPLPELGDAFWDRTELAARKGSVVIRITAKKGNYRDNLDMAKKAAALVLARLP
jgi:hypothetical protein